jgi:hypothetical protein
MPVTSAVTEAVTVTAIDSCGSVTCDCAGTNCNSKWPVTAQETRVVLSGAGDSQSWSFFFAVPSLPADQIQVGDTLDLSVQASQDSFSGLSQQVVLARAGKLVIFSSNLSDIMFFPLPLLTGYGIAITDTGAICGGSGTCPVSTHAVQATVGGTSKLVIPGQTVTVGNLTLSVQTLAGSSTSCDRAAYTSMSGFTTQ